MNLIKHINIVSILILVVLSSCSNVNHQISELGQRYLDDIFKSKQLSEVRYLLILTPSQCESCIIKGHALLKKIDNAQNSSSFVIVSTHRMINHFDDCKHIRFESELSSVLHSYGFVGNLGFLYDLVEQREVELNLDSQSKNLKIINSYCN